MECAASCADDVVEAIKAEDQAAACSLDLSCATECFSEAWVHAHCACESNMMFSSTSFDFAGSEAFCCSESTDCQGAVPAFFEELLSDSIGNNASAIAAYLEQECSSTNC
jgi:hypothetical protein